MSNSNELFRWLVCFIKDPDSNEQERERQCIKLARLTNIKLSGQLMHYPECDFHRGRLITTENVSKMHNEVKRRIGGRMNDREKRVLLKTFSSVAVHAFALICELVSDDLTLSDGRRQELSLIMTKYGHPELAIYI